MFKLDKNEYDNTFYFCETSGTIQFGPCNIMIAQQNIDVILSICNKYKQL